MEKRTNIPGIDCEIFGSLSNAMLARLNEIRQIKSYKKGDYIFFEGKNPTGVYCIHEGYIKIFKIGKDGKSKIIYISRPGDLIGWEQLTEDYYTKNAVALEDTVLSWFPKEGFIDIIKDDCILSLALTKYLCKGNLMLESHIFLLYQGSLRQRLAINLLFLVERLGFHFKENILLRVSLSRQDLADLIGTNTETTVKLLSQFRREGIIEFHEKKMIILNTSVLKEICEI
jgi:CRP/FNR family transcriptional regulator